MPRSVAAVSPPWDSSRPSIHGFIVERIDDHGSLGMHPSELPDEVRDPSSISFSAGSMDGIARHWDLGKADDEIVTTIISALVKLARRPTARSAQELYEIVSAERTLGYVDKVLEFLPAAGIAPDRLREVGEWLAGQAPDRSAVKFGIALVGVAPPADESLLLTLGAHDEFTLYAAVALSNSGAGERGLFELAKRVHGWGRIETVERLAETMDPDIKRWMLLEGFKNSVMYEYLAQICARTGDLLGGLSTDPSDELIGAAGELIEAILVGQPGPPPQEYPDLVPVLREYVTLISRRRGTLAERRVMAAIRRLIVEPYDVVVEEADLDSILPLADEFLARPHFAELARAGLMDPDGQVYWAAKTAAADFGIDIYEAASARVQSNMDEHPLWFDLMQATDEERIERTLDLARSKLDLAALATGPTTDMGLGPDYEADSALGFILQDLRRFPGHGWDFVVAGLNNRVVRNRNLAIRILQELPRDEWPDGAADALRAAITAEIDEGVRQFATDVLHGEVSVEEAWRRTFDQLRERQPKLAVLAAALAETPQGRQLRVQAGFMAQLFIWDGTYDTQPHQGRSVVVTHDAAGFNAYIREANGPLEQTEDRWSHDEAIPQVAALMNHLLTE